LLSFDGKIAIRIRIPQGTYTQTFERHRFSSAYVPPQYSDSSFN
jgi:hypothetical protein